MTNDMRVIVEFAAHSCVCVCVSLSPSPWRRSVSESYFKTKGSDGIQIQPRVLLELFTYFFFSIPPFSALRDGSRWFLL